MPHTPNGSRNHDPATTRKLKIQMSAILPEWEYTGYVREQGDRYAHDGRVIYLLANQRERTCTYYYNEHVRATFTVTDNASLQTKIRNFERDVQEHRERIHLLGPIVLTAIEGLLLQLTLCDNGQLAVQFQDHHVVVSYYDGEIYLAQPYDHRNNRERAEICDPNCIQWLRNQIVNSVIHYTGRVMNSLTDRIINLEAQASNARIRLRTLELCGKQLRVMNSLTNRITNLEAQASNARIRLRVLELCDKQSKEQRELPCGSTSPATS